MARFLSSAWLDQVEAAAGASEQLRKAAEEVDLTVRQVVRDGPDGVVSYSVRLSDGQVRVVRESNGPPDIEVLSDYATAASISRGELSPAVALADGRLRLNGRVGLLAEHQDLFAGLGDLLGPVREATEY